MLSKWQNKSTTDLTGRVGQGQQLYWEYTILGTNDSRDMSSGVKIILLQVWSFSQSNLPDRKRVEEIMLLKVTKICILGTFSLEERLYTKLFPDRKETTEIIALSYSQVNDKSWLYNNMFTIQEFNPANILLGTCHTDWGLNSNILESDRCVWFLHKHILAV